MRKLYFNINDITILGNPTKLSDVITKMDYNLQRLSADTEKIKYTVYKKSTSNQGHQYTNVVNATKNLSVAVYNASVIMNDVQHQICQYIYKCCKYEEIYGNIPVPRKHDIKIVKLDTITSVIIYRKEDMIQVRNALVAYVAASRREAQNLRANREFIRSIWKDTQFELFSKYVDEICAILRKGADDLETYANHLTNLINDL